MELSKVAEKCPDCGGTDNSRLAGGNERCFHCGDCPYVQCSRESYDSFRESRPS